MGPRLSSEARSLLRRQRSLLATWQAPAIGISPRALVRAAGMGAWQRLTPRVFLAGEADALPGQLRMAALLESGPQAMLSGCSALAEAGWSGDDRGFVDVLVPRAARSRARELPPWIRLRETTSIPRYGGHPRCVTTPRATVDAAAWAGTPRERMFIVTSVLQQRLTAPGLVRRELADRGRVRWSTQIREVLDEVESGVTSLHEAQFRRECRVRGLPVPRMQVRHLAGGRRRVVDAQFVSADGRLVIVEIDGAAHMHVEQWHADLSRQNDLATESGAILLRVTGWQLRFDAEGFWAVLRNAVLG